MNPQPGQLYGVTLEFVGINVCTGLGVYNVIGIGTATQVEIRQVYP